MTRTYAVRTADALPPAAERPTMYFIGVSTGESSIRQVFPRWAHQLGLGDVELVGLDLPIHADPEIYRSVVEFLRSDPLSLGALVTTHKIDIFRAAADLFDVIDGHARAMGEISSISKGAHGLTCHAKDPISSGLALDSFVPAGHWAATRADVVCFGAGGSSIAITWYLSQASRGADRPRRIVVSNRSAARLDHIADVHRRLAVDIPVEYALTPRPEDNDALLDGLPAGSLIVNATGLGKDAPGSPITGLARFPDDGLAWELNYRGSLDFLHQAKDQEVLRRLHLEDGWTYFLHGWTQVIAEVFDVEIPPSGPAFDDLSNLAGGPPVRL